jgi:hypothetical protein
MLRSIEWQQQTIAENEERFHGAIHEAPIPIMITGDSGEVVELNRAQQILRLHDGRSSDDGVLVLSCLERRGRSAA